jgi:hypothetical protein
MKLALKWLAILGFTVLGIWLFIRTFSGESFDGIIEGLKSVGVLGFLGFLGISLFNFTLAAWRWYLISNTGEQNERFTFSQIFWDRMAGYGLAYLTPVTLLGGEPVKIALQANRGVSLERATSNTLVDSGMDLIASLAFLLLGGSIAIIFGLLEVDVSWVFTVLALVLLLAGWFTAKKAVSDKGLFRPLAEKGRVRAWMFQFPASLERRLYDLFDGSSRVRIITILSLAFVIMRIPEMIYLGWVTGVKMNVLDAILVATLPGFALFLPIPAGLGAFESGFGWVFELLGLGGSALLFVVLVRSRDLVLLILGFVHALRVGITSLYKTSAEIKKKV